MSNTLPVATPAPLQGLSENQLRKCAPAVFARKGAPKRTSKRYVPLPTIDVIRVLEKEGFMVTSARQDAVRRRDPEFARHMVCFTHKEHLGKAPAKVGDTVPRIVLTGSANGTAPFELRAGLFRLICGNGMVIPVGAYGSVATKHIYVKPAEVTAQVKALAAQADQATSAIARWKRIHLSEKAQQAFAREALKLRSANETGRYEAADLLQARREEDTGDDLWRVFNRVQENATRGGFVGRSAVNRATRARPIAAIIREVSFNEKLWTLAEKAAQDHA